MLSRHSNARIEASTEGSGYRHSVRQRNSVPVRWSAQPGTGATVHPEIPTENEFRARPSLEYFDKLKPSCIEVGVSYDDRVARRKEEIASLQDALKILSGEDI